MTASAVLSSGLTQVVLCNFIHGLIIGFLCVSGCDAPPPAVPPGTGTSESVQVVRQFCGDCHAFPEADTYPAHVWPEKIQEGFGFYYSSLRDDLEVPTIRAVELYYAERAPEELTISATTRPVGTTASGFFHPGRRLQPSQPLRSIAHLRNSPPDYPEFRLIAADMRTGQVWGVSPQEKSVALAQITSCRNPCHIEPVDLDQDGHTDFVVGDLGSFLPEDHDSGAVWLIRYEPTNQQWNAEILADGIGRVADVRVLDADADGDMDLVVGEFGWRATGSIFLLRNDTDPNDSRSIQMTKETIDPRHGASHMPVADLNTDGHPDFVALISQEHETVVAFLNQGDGSFKSETIFQSDNPGFGSCGIELSDIDADGDLDVVFVNGDSLDTPTVKPYHSVCWFENKGSYPYEAHEICKLPGGYCVRSADMDADGDVDIAAVSLLPGPVRASFPSGTFDSVIWLEQTDNSQFVGHSLERDLCVHAACEILDWDADGDLDLVVADMAVDPTAERPLTIFHNRASDEVPPESTR